MNRRRFQRIALPLLAVLFALVAVQQLRGLFGHRHHDRVIRVERIHSDDHRHERHHDHRLGHFEHHVVDERHDVVIHIN